MKGVIEKFIYWLLYLIKMEVKKSIFLRTFGDTPILRVLDFLATYSMYDYSMTDIASNAGIGYTTLKLFWKDFVNKSMVIQTRIVGKAKMYQLNKDNIVVMDFLKLYNTIIEKETDKIIAKEKYLTINAE